VAGEIRTMRIVKAHDYELTGELIDQPVRPRERFVQIA
jgi:hypothetical protein